VGNSVSEELVMTTWAERMEAIAPDPGYTRRNQEMTNDTVASPHFSPGF
jgi:hypothetical protein